MEEIEEIRYKEKVTEVKGITPIILGVTYYVTVVGACIKYLIWG